MDRCPRRWTPVGLIMTVVALALMGCGVSDGTGVADVATTAPPMRPPKSLCERVPLDVVEEAIQLELDPGTPSEKLDHPQCTWRESGKAEVVTLDLYQYGEDFSVEDYTSTVGSDDGVEVPDLGDTALWFSTLTKLGVFTGEGVFEVDLYNHELDEDGARTGAITVLRTVIATTAVPDTTTTTASTAPSEPEGLCRTISIETVEQAVDKVVEPGVFTQPSGGGAPSCTFRALTEGPAVTIRLDEYGTMDFLDTIDHDEIDELGVPARMTVGTGELYVDTFDGLVTIRLDLMPETGAEVRAGLLALAQDYLDPD